MNDIVFFVTGLENGGLENYLLRFLKDRHKNYNRIIVFCKGGFGGYLEDEYREIANVELVYKKIRYLNLKDYFFMFSYFRKYKNYVICDFTGTFSGFIMFTAKLAGIKKRLVFYRESEYQFKFSLAKKCFVYILEKSVLRFSTNILANSKHVFENLLGIKYDQNKKFVVIYNGLNVNEFLSVKDDLKAEYGISYNKIVVGHIGRYTPAKNHTTLIKVALELCVKYDHLVFLFCGKGVPDNVINKIPLNLRDRFYLFENRRDIPKVLNTIDIFYFPSVNEGQPNSLIEAMVMGKKIISSNIPTIKECVPIDYFKYLVEPESISDTLDMFDLFLMKEISIDLKKWSINEFNSVDRFSDFEKYLKI